MSEIPSKYRAEKKNLIELKRLVYFLEQKPDKLSYLQRQIKALHWAINKLEETQPPKSNKGGK